VFHWVYAITHCRDYRKRFWPQLCFDFPRIPTPNSVHEFQKLKEQGEILARSHLRAARVTRSRSQLASCAGPTTIEIPWRYPRWETPDRLLLNRNHVWPEPIEIDVWRFQVGGYEVLARWLKQRRPRGLDVDDQAHFRQMVSTIRETLRTMSSLELLCW
jgi:hypothetical protein